MGDDWEEITKESNADSWDIDTQPEIIGKYVEHKEDVGPNNSHQYFIQELEKTEPTLVWGSKVLDDKMADVALGATVKLVYVGKVKGAKFSYKDFKVFVKPL